MPDPDTDISAASRGDELPDLEGPAEDDAEAAYDPDGIEASRARELGLGVGERDLQRQRDVYGDGPATREGDVERLTADEVLTGDDASDLGVDEAFDSEDEDGERQDDRATFTGVPQSDYRRQ